MSNTKLTLEDLKKHLTPRKVFYVLAVLTVAPIVLAVLYTAWVLSTGLPSLEKIENPKPELATQILSSDGELLDQYYIKQRRYMPLDSIPKDFINALIATEDREFFNHWGIHVFRLIKLAILKVTLGVPGGGSTITQQLARNLYLSHEQTLSRKIKEAFTTLEIERTHTKREILELYANTVYFGRGANGLQVAAQVYFGKSPQQLNTAECAYLVGVVQRPGRFEKDEDAAKQRRNVVLYAMREMGFINDGVYQSMKNVPVVLATPEEVEMSQNVAPHFVEWIRQKLSSEEGLKEYGLKGYDLYRDGLIISTTLNARMQRYANDAVEAHLQEFQKEFMRGWSWKGKEDLLNEFVEKEAKKTSGYINAQSDAERKSIVRGLKANPEFVQMVKEKATHIQTGFVAIDHASGEIRAMVGSSVFGKEARYSLNHVTQIRRQPGSSFKAFVYAAALSAGMSPYSEVESGTLSHLLPSGKTWKVVGSKDGGPMALASALKFSINSVAARLVTENIRPSDVIKVARKAGIKSDLDAVPSISLGSEEVTPLEMTAAFSFFPNQGVYIEPYAIAKIEDRYGNVLYDHSKKPMNISDVVKPKVARDMVGMMRNVVDGGTASRVRRWYPYEAAGKTGTTNDFTDAWFVGFTPQVSAGVWIGFDDQRVKFTGWYAQGGAAASPIWARFMAKVYKDPLLGYKASMRFNAFTPETSGSSSSTEEPLENVVPNAAPSASTDSTSAEGIK